VAGPQEAPAPTLRGPICTRDTETTAGPEAHSQLGKLLGGDTNSLQNQELPTHEQRKLGHGQLIQPGK
jgi:hypothetical protein